MREYWKAQEYQEEQVGVSSKLVEQLVSEVLMKVMGRQS